MDFDVDLLDRRRARAEARSRLFASSDRVMLGRYELVSRIGAGAWGTVYQALDPLTSRMVAVKVIHARVEGHSQPFERWRREAQLLAKLDHPHVIGVYDVGVDAGRAYLVTQLVRGGRTLTQWLATTRTPPADLLRRFVPLADALSAVHACGVLHRDIKPDNILVDGNGDFRLADFGLASELHDVARQGPSTRFEGTPAFLPPEVRDGAPPDERADLYSLCGALWFAVCGAPPSQGTPPRRFRRLFQVGLAREPVARFECAGELKTALEKASRSDVPWPQLVGSLGIGLATTLAVVPPTTLASEPMQAPASALHTERPFHPEGVLRRIEELQASEDFEGAAALALESLRATEFHAARAQLELALGRARHGSGAHEDAPHVLESAFFHASASGDPQTASRAALLRLEVAVDAADLWAANVWSAQTEVWMVRRPTVDAGLELRFATARSRLLVLAGRPREALDALPASVGMEDLPPRPILEFLFQRGQLLMQLGLSAEGVAALEAANELTARHFPLEHGLRRSARWNLATAQSELGDFDSALEGFEGLLRSVEGSSSVPFHEVAELRRNLGGIHLMLGDIPRALAHTSAALEANVSAYGETHPRTLDTLGNLAAILHADDQHAAAKAMSWRALVAAETAYGIEHPSLVPVLSNLAVMSTSAGDDAEAEALLRRAKAIVETHRGRQHREMAMIHTNLAHALLAGGDTAGAFEAATRALEIDEAVLGPNHPELGEGLLQLASMQLDAGRIEAARAHALRLRALPSVTSGRRARAAFILAQLEALDHPTKAPRAWLSTAAAELELSPQDLDSDFALALKRWQLDWRAELSELRK